MRSAPEEYHRHLARLARDLEVLDGRARPFRPATPADSFTIEPDAEELAGYLPGPVPWRSLSDAAVVAACQHPDAAVRKRARRENNRRTYGK